MLGKKNIDTIKVEGQVTAGDLSHITLKWNKKGNHSNVYYNLKRLVPVDNPCLLAGKDILKVSQDCVLCTYHSIFF